MNDPDLRFDAAINPYGCAPAVVAALSRAVEARAYRHYGDPDAGGLRRKLATHHGLSADNFLVYNGSGEGMVWQALTRLLLPRGAFVCPFPSYERFVDIGRRCARIVVEVPLEKPAYRLPLARFTDEIRRNEARVAMLSTPNNPTGNTLLDAKDLITLLDSCPECTIVVDEAYAEYTGQTFAPLVSRFPNLIVLKTFSKAYGLAGLRVGYVVGHERAIAEARRFQIPWSVDSLALVAAEAALDQQQYLGEIVARIAADVRVFGQELAALPDVVVSPTAANFYLLELRRDRYRDLGTRLQEHGMVVRRRADLPDHIRVTSMLPPANKSFIQAMAAIGGAG